MSLLEELDREGLSALAAEILAALGEDGPASPEARREVNTLPEQEAEAWEALLPLAARTAARQRDWRAAALRKGAPAEGTAGSAQTEGAPEAAFLRVRQRFSAGVGEMAWDASPAEEGLSPPEAAYLRGGEAGTARQTGDLPREDRTARREAEAVSRILERGARGYDAGFIHY